MCHVTIYVSTKNVLLFYNSYLYFNYSRLNLAVFSLIINLSAIKPSFYVITYYS